MKQTALITLFLTPALSAQAFPGHWNQWRGPDRSGHTKTVAWPTKLTGLTRAWRMTAGPSYSGPVVDEDTVYTTATEDKEAEVVTAFDRQTGKVRWKTEWMGAMNVPFFAARNGSWIRSTPILDNGRLYVAGMRDVLVCLDTKTGKKVWAVDFTKRFHSKLESFGFVCSPMIESEVVIVQTGAGLVALDKTTGKTRWHTMKDKGGMFGGAFSSPIAATLRDTRQLLVQTRTALNGVAPKDGALLWSVPIKSFRGMNILTPLPIGDAVFTSAYGGRGHLIDIDGTDAGLTAKKRWSNRVQAYMTSPIQIGDHAYVLLRSKRFCCFDVRSGKLAWTSPPTGDTYWSLVTNGKQILALADDGELFLLAADPKAYRVLARKSVSDSESWAHLAVDGDQIFVRDLDGLSAFTWKPES